MSAPTARQRARLLKLIKFLEKLPPQRFDLGTFIDAEHCLNLAEVTDQSATVRKDIAKKNINHCGTVACALGWTPRLFPRLVSLVHSERHHYLPVTNDHLMEIGVAVELFGMDVDEAHALFFPWGIDYRMAERGYIETNIQSPPKDVAHNLKLWLKEHTPKKRKAA